MKRDLEKASVNSREWEKREMERSHHGMGKNS